MPPPDLSIPTFLLRSPSAAEARAESRWAANRRLASLGRGDTFPDEQPNDRAEGAGTTGNCWHPPAALPDLRRVGIIALDTETKDEGLADDRGPAWPWRGGHVCGVSVAYHEGADIRAHYFPLRHPDSNNFDPTQLYQWLRDLVASDVRIVTQNGLYDWGWLHNYAGIKMPPAERLEEIGALATLIDENRHDYSLDALCKWRGLPGKDLGLLQEGAAAIGLPKRAKVKSHIWQLPAHFVGPYAEADAANTLALFESLNPILDREKTRAAYRIEVDLLPMVLEMRRRGIRIDVDAAERARDLLLAKRDAVFAELKEKLGANIGMEEIGRNKWLVETFDAQGIAYPKTDKGNASFTSGVTGWMDKHEHWLPQLISKADRYNKAAVDFLEGHILRHVINGRIHADIHPHRSDDGGTRSMRLSYSDPPLQQMPARDKEITPLIRGCFLPEVGEVWAKPDISQQEFRFIVHYAVTLGLPRAREAAEQYRTDPAADFHKIVAGMTDLDRTTAKQVNFAKAFGAGVKKFAEMTGKSESEAKKIYKQYDQQLPFVKALSKLCESRAHSQGYLELYDGARRHWDDWAPNVEWTKGAGPCPREEAERRLKDSEHPWFGKGSLLRADTYKAMNALIQGSAARHTKLWMLACWREGIVPLLQMHDCLDLSVSSPEIAERVAQLGREAVKLEVPIQVDLKYGHSWGDAEHSWNELRTAPGTEKTAKATPEPDASADAEPVEENDNTMVPPGVDITLAIKFLQMLDPTAAKTGNFTYQTYHDRAPGQKKDNSLARVIHGREHNRLLELHAGGAGVSVAANETDGKGRRSKNITRIRAIWRDADAPNLPALPLEPSLVVETSPGHVHEYLLVADKWPANEKGCADFDGVMDRLVEDYGADPGTTDLPHAMRIPGFLHRKHEPHLVRIIAPNDSGEDVPRYTRAEILAAFPPIERKECESQPHIWLNDDNYDLELAREALTFIDADEYGVWLKCGMALHERFGEYGRELWDTWSAKSDECDESTQKSTWKSFGKRTGVTLGTLFYYAQEAGWTGCGGPHLNGGEADGETNADAGDTAEEARSDESEQSAETDDGSTQQQSADDPGDPEAAPEQPTDASAKANGREASKDAAWPVMGSAAFHGLAGEVVTCLAPHTESDPVALLLQYLVSFGNVIGRGPHYRIEDDRHLTNLFAVLVGQTSKSRKGTSAGRIRAILDTVDSEWVRERVLGGMSSGEGVIAAVRDAAFAMRKGELELVDAGITDKRLLLDEREFFQALAVLKREGSILSRVVRDAWDGRETLATLTKHSPTKATNALISIVGHITADELRQALDHTSMANGYANRFLFACVKRSKLLPHGGALDEPVKARLGAATREALAAARSRERIEMTPAAACWWENVYAKLAEGSPGLLGSITDRAEAQTIRLGLLYALLDQAPQIDVGHLEAALAVWNYCAASAQYIFGDIVGDPVADTILRALRNAGRTGMSRTDIINHFGRNLSAGKIDTALAALLAAGKARSEKQSGGGRGRPIEMWFAG